MPQGDCWLLLPPNLGWGGDAEAKAKVWSDRTTAEIYWRVYNVCHGEAAKVQMMDVGGLPCEPHIAANASPTGPEFLPFFSFTFSSSFLLVL
jgi:hypothetical protein